MLLQNFREKYLELLLQFLWRQWSILGVAGYAESQDKWIIDPEALLLFSLSISRYDQRLFDEILDWLDKNESSINVQRLKTILIKENFASISIIGAVAKKLTEKNKSLKWKSLAKLGKKLTTENLFFLKNGQPLPVIGKSDSTFLTYGQLRNEVKNRKNSNRFNPNNHSNLMLKLRAFMGLTARTESFTFLLINQKGTIQEIANATYYSWRSIQEALFEMGHSNIINFPIAKKGRVYSINSQPWLDIFLNKKNIELKWVNWAPLFRSLEIIWLKLNEAEFHNETSLVQATEFRELLIHEIAPLFEKAGSANLLTNISQHYGEDFLNIFFKNLTDIL